MSIVREMAAAGPGCAVANGILNAFETTKVKLQLQDPVRPAYSANTSWGVMQQIVREEGFVRGLLTPGLSASLTRSCIYGGYRVGLYSTIRDELRFLQNNNNKSSRDQQRPSSNPKALTNVIVMRIASGMITGGIGAMLTCPLDVVRTRMQADAGLVNKNGIYVTGLRRGQAVRYNSMFSTLVSILKEEGLAKGIYRGATVTVARASLLNGAQLASYDTLKKISGRQEGPILHLTCALASGVIAQTVVMPIDTIKSSMMMGNNWGNVLKVLRTNGPIWLYRGYLPACAGQGLIMVLQMPLIEQFRRFLGVEAI
ncbi:mitochondrial carrier protein [Nitzschia inconspicua]|uniref:Mitochondrial carrier protein n=1 Tax=Nitzschia inconspicua TaxID=303405 RepID=A0A9K3LUP8_9STRA|nr:mitochondrial carrier protein [Nitzschia inconspicua]